MKPIYLLYIRQLQPINSFLPIHRANKVTSLTDEYTIFYTSQSKIQYFHVCFTERGDRRASL